MLRYLAVLVSKLLFRVEVRGKKNIPEKGAFILASNHLSYLDPIALGVACPRKLNFMAKQELFSNPFFSWFISKLGAFPVKRSKTDISALKEAMNRVNSGNVLVVFPQGSRAQGAESLEPQPGIGFLASHTGVPIIPVFICGTEKVLPKGARFIKLAKVSVHFGKQIPIERRVSYQDIAQQVMDNIRHLGS